MRCLSKITKVGVTISSIGYIIMIILILFNKTIPYFVNGIFSTGVFITIASEIFPIKESENI